MKIWSRLNGQPKKGGQKNFLLLLIILAKCRMSEIDPIYCQVIIDRWEKYTGKKAEKING